MSIKQLEAFIADENWINNLFSKPLIDINAIDAELAQNMFDSIDGKLSPENLHCDGEITAAQARKKAKVLLGAAAQLQKMGYFSTCEWSEFNPNNAR